MPVAAVERDDDGVAHAVGRQPAPGLGHARVPGHEHRLAVVDDLRRAATRPRASAGSSDRVRRPAASSRTRATSSPSGPMNAAVARSDVQQLLGLAEDVAHDLVELDGAC